MWENDFTMSDEYVGHEKSRGLRCLASVRKLRPICWANWDVN